MPFDLFDARGWLLLAANQSLEEPAVRERLRLRNEFFADAEVVAFCRPELMQVLGAAEQEEEPLLASDSTCDWRSLIRLADTVLAQPDPGGSWVEGVNELHARMRSLAVHRWDEALCHLIYQGSRHANDYSSCQALRCALIAGALASTLGWDALLIEAVEKAALTMNVAMRRLQDQLALQPDASIDQDTRKLIARHSLDGAKLLLASGVTDHAWLDTVRFHHDSSLEGPPTEQLAPGQRLALLLRRVDIYSAMLSRRVTRSALTPMQAARKACFGPDGRPDRIGAALLKTIGLYPPGSFVQLCNQEKGVVVCRGVRPNEPLVAVLVDAYGELLPEPRLRDTARPGRAVRTELQADSVVVDPPTATWAALHSLGRKLRRAM